MGAGLQGAVGLWGQAAAAHRQVGLHLVHVLLEAGQHLSVLVPVGGQQGGRALRQHLRCSLIGLLAGGKTPPPNTGQRNAVSPVPSSTPSPPSNNFTISAHEALKPHSFRRVCVCVKERVTP